MYGELIKEVNDNVNPGMRPRCSSQGASFKSSRGLNVPLRMERSRSEGVNAGLVR